MNWERADVARRWTRASNVVSLDAKRAEKQERAALQQLHPRGRLVDVVSIPTVVSEQHSIRPCCPGDDAA